MYHGFHKKKKKKKAAQLFSQFRNCHHIWKYIQIEDSFVIILY